MLLPLLLAAAALPAAFDASKLEAARERIANRGTKALLIVQDGRTVLEWYAPGSSASSKHYTASLAKALVGGTSLLLATADGYIRADDKAAKYIPSWANDPLKSKITVRQLATHTSGIEDAEQGDLAHDKLPGWKGAFWRREPDPFTVALLAPVIFEPGSAFHYSNPGMAALAYAVTASLRSAPQKDIETLLRDRLMRKLGIPDDDWSIGYGRPYEVDGMQLYANWGGASYTPRASAHVGEWIMRSGSPIMPERFVQAALKYAGTAISDRHNDAYQPATTLGWYTNFDRVWPTVPRNAFAGAGAQQQLLLVIPSLRMVIVRNGGTLEPKQPFWTAAYKHVFEPLMQALQNPPRALAAPYPQSPVIRGVNFSPEIARKAIGSDNWPMTWGADGDLYTSYGDGWGFEPLLKQKLSLGIARISGGPDDFRGTNLRSPTIEREGDGKSGPKASGLISVDRVLYMWVRNIGNSQLVWSTDSGKTWEWGFKFEESFASPSFLNFVRNNDNARDAYVYAYSQDGPSAYESNDGVVLARAPSQRIRERAQWEFFAGEDSNGRVKWSKDMRSRRAVFRFPANCQRTDAVYNPGLKRYLLAVAYGHSGGWGIYDAPEPWGPWTTAFHTEYWGLGETHGYRLPSKWISADGRAMALVFSGMIYNTVSYDAFCVRKMTLDVAAR